MFALCLVSRIWHSDGSTTFLVFHGLQHQTTPYHVILQSAEIQDYLNSLFSPFCFNAFYPCFWSVFYSALPLDRILDCEIKVTGKSLTKSFLALTTSFFTNIPSIDTLETPSNGKSSATYSFREYAASCSKMTRLLVRSRLPKKRLYVCRFQQTLFAHHVQG